VSKLIEVKVPDIGDFQDVDVIEILVKPGDKVAKDDSLLTLESDKATMDIPSPFAGIIKEVMVTAGSKVSQGTLIAMMEVEAETAPLPEEKTIQTEKVIKAAPKAPAATLKESAIPEAETVQRPAKILAAEQPGKEYSGHPHPTEVVKTSLLDLHAGPSVRKLARDLGVDLAKVVGSGRKGRITQEDVEAFVRKTIVQKESKQEGFQMPSVPAVDFGKFGEIEVHPMKRIQKLSARNLHRNWITIPHVTHFDEADITDLEEFRKKHNETVIDKADRLTLMPFLFKAVVSGMKKYPTLNSSLDPEGENLILKSYFHIGMAVDTENGLLVPVVRDVDQKTLQELAREMRALTIKSREGTIKREEMQGGCFTISNLGGIGGTGFTPIINAPEVAILGVPRSTVQPVFQNGQFVPRLMLPLSLSYDHRVVDGALAARYLAHVCDLLTDIRKML
jgi:pyruvate dehydrogenase E2 component (dihydrolipoamide acetyltransferase)